MNGRVGVSGDDIIHEVEEFDAPPTRLVRGGDLAGCHLEGSEQGAGAIALVIMAVAGQCPAVRELEIALCPLQRLDRGLLVAANSAFVQAVTIAEKVAKYRHAQLSAVRLAGDINATVTDNASLDELLDKIKDELRKLGPLIDLEAIWEPRGSRA